MEKRSSRIQAVDLSADLDCEMIDLVDSGEDDASVPCESKPKVEPTELVEAKPKLEPIVDKEEQKPKIKRNRSDSDSDADYNLLNKSKCSVF